MATAIADPRNGTLRFFGIRLALPGRQQSWRLLFFNPSSQVLIESGDTLIAFNRTIDLDRPSVVLASD